jgi:hypothetical protein
MRDDGDMEYYTEWRYCNIDAAECDPDYDWSVTEVAPVEEEPNTCSTYRGTKAVAESGDACVKWNSENQE